MTRIAVSSSVAPVLLCAAIKDALGNVMDRLSAHRLVTTAICSIDQITVAFTELTAIVVCCRCVDIRDGFCAVLINGNQVRVKDEGTLTAEDC